MKARFGVRDYQEKSEKEIKGENKRTNNNFPHQNLKRDAINLSNIQNVTFTSENCTQHEKDESM